jgi:hypothetical protein
VVAPIWEEAEGRKMVGKGKERQNKLGNVEQKMEWEKKELFG